MADEKFSGISISDAHCHLPKEKGGEGVAFWLEQGVEFLFLSPVSQQQAEWDELYRWSESFPDRIVSSFGIHPWLVADLMPNWEQQLFEFLSRKNVGIGEIGLDRSKDHFFLQERIFRKQLELLKGLTPRLITIHCVRSYDRLIPILREYDEIINRFPIVLHSFHGSIALVKQLLSLKNLYFSFSAAVGHDFFVGRKGREVIAAIPNERILLESDGRGLTALQEIYRKMATIKEILPDCWARLIRKNVIELKNRISS